MNITIYVAVIARLARICSCALVLCLYIAMVDCSYAEKPAASVTVDYSGDAGKISNYIAGITDGPAYDKKSYENMKKGQFKFVEVFVWLSQHEPMHPIPPEGDGRPAFPDRRDRDAREGRELERNIQIAKKQISSIFEIGAEPLIFMISGRKPDDMGKYKKQVKSVINELQMSAREAGKDLRLFRFNNEPDLPMFWLGTREDFFETYKAWALSVKELSPKYVVEAPSFMSATARDMFDNNFDYVNDFTTEFLEYCKKNRVPLDVFSFHFYGPKISNLSRELVAVKKTLNKYPTLSPIFGVPKIGVDEWNLWVNMRNKHTDMFDTVFAAAHNIGALITMLRNDVWVSVRFGGVIGDIGPIRNENKLPPIIDYLMMKPGVGPKPVYYGYLAFNELFSTPHLLSVADTKGIMSAAGKSSDGKHLNILLSFYDEELAEREVKKYSDEKVDIDQNETRSKNIRVIIKNLPWQKIIEQVEIVQSFISDDHKVKKDGVRKTIIKKDHSADVSIDVSSNIPSIVLIKVNLK